LDCRHLRRVLESPQIRPFGDAPARVHKVTIECQADPAPAMINDPLHVRHDEDF